MSTHPHRKILSPLARPCIVAFAAFGVMASLPAMAANTINGQVLGAGAPIAGSTVTLWAANTGAPRQLAQTQTGADGRFVLTGDSNGASLYLIAKGGRPTANATSRDNPAIALMTVLGGTVPANAVINEMTTVASVWTHAQFLNDDAIGGNALGLRIAAGNVPNFVDLQTGGWGGAIQDPLNSGQTPTMANFATLADVFSGCVTQATADACSKLFAAATPPKGAAPTNTLAAAQSIARYPWYQPERLFALLDAFYPLPSGEPPPGTVHAVRQLRPECLGAAVQVRRRRLSRGGQGDVRQRGQPLGWRQLYGGLAGAGCVLARPRYQVQPQR